MPHRSHVLPDFDALFFDMDGLLLDTERVGAEAFADLTRTFGIADQAARTLYLGLVGSSSAETRRQVSDFIPGVDIDTFVADWHLAVAGRMAAGVPLRPKVRDVFDLLAGQGRAMAVVTSTGRERARRHLDEAGLLHHFHEVVGGDEVAANKPDPAPYLEAARRLGVDPSRAAAFEDSDRGTRAAVAAGCVTVQVPDLRPPGRPLPRIGQHVAGDLLAAFELLDLLSAGPR